MRLLLVTIAGLTLLAAGCRSDEPAPTAITRTTDSSTPPVSPEPSATPDPRTTIVLDPGHGGDEVGAANYGVVEKDSNLDMALRIERLLLAEGYRVVLTRREDARVAIAPSGVAEPTPGGTPDPAAASGAAGSSFGATRFDLQARIDIANEAQGDVFIAIHSNGSPSASESGVEVWYDPQRAFGGENAELAGILQRGVLEALASYGYAARDRGLKDDTCFREREGRCFPLFVLGPERSVRREDLMRRGLDPNSFGFEPGEQVRTTRATAMPGALVELLFISNALDAAVLADDAGREASARGVVAGIVAFTSQ